VEVVEKEEGYYPLDSEGFSWEKEIEKGDKGFQAARQDWGAGVHGDGGYGEGLVQGAGIRVWLGHPSDQVMSVLSKNIGLKYDKLVSHYDICHKAKQTRVHFPLSDHKSVSVGDLVHLDMWGPYRVVSKDGYKYFLTMIDYYNRVVWAYLIKTKDEVSFLI
nr:ribonuclease H-like domain-containing protein [Tanacetum cinerariifolium]